ETGEQKRPWCGAASAIHHRAERNIDAGTHDNAQAVEHERAEGEDAAQLSGRGGIGCHDSVHTRPCEILLSRDRRGLRLDSNSPFWRLGGDLSRIAAKPALPAFSSGKSHRGA